MGKNFIHGFAGNFAKEFNGPNFVAMESPAPYSQWQAVVSSGIGTIASGAGFATVTDPSGYGYVIGQIEFWMAAPEGISNISATASQSNNDSFNSVVNVYTSVNGTAQTPVSCYAGDYSGYPGYPAAYPATGVIAIPYYRFRLCAELIVNAGATSSGDWIRVDFTLS